MRPVALVVVMVVVGDAGVAGADAGMDDLRRDRTLVGIGESMGDYVGAAHGGSGGRIVLGRTVGDGCLRLGAEYGVSKYADRLAQRFGADVRWTPPWFSTPLDPGADAGPYFEVGIGRQVTARGSRTDAELGLGLHIASAIDFAGVHFLDQIFGVTVIVAPTWAEAEGARCAGGCPERDAFEVGVYFTAETAM